MSKTIVFLSFLCLGVLFALGLAAPDSSIMWMASTSSSYAYIRLAVMVMLGSLLVTTPPRNKYLRAAVGLASVMLITWSYHQTFFNHMQFLDGMAFFVSGIASAIIALEFRPDPVEHFGRYEIY
jgi:hypothetical protein